MEIYKLVYMECFYVFRKFCICLVYVKLIISNVYEILDEEYGFIDM